MKILIIGATGSIGTVVTHEALNAGHDVSVYVRNPSKINEFADKVKIYKGELNDQNSLKKAMDGAQAILSCAGAMNNKTGQIEAFETGMKTIVAAMKSKGIKRIISISGMLAPAEGDEVTLFMKVMRPLMAKVMNQVVGSNIKQYEILSATQLDWTIVRSGILTNGPATGRLKADARKNLGLKLSRKDLAVFFMEQLTDTIFIRKAPMVAVD